jgi:sigma-B regulation protein RsbU (phosphoserine phosphatase)
MPPHGHYCVPIVTDDELIGVLNLYVKHGHERTAKEDRFLSAVASIFAGTVKRERAEESLREREGQLIAAQRIQEQILPTVAPDIPGLDVAGGLTAAEFAAGDYYDYLQMPDGSLGIVIGDVCGHGVGSALLTASTAAHLRSFVQEHSDLRDVLVRTNCLLCREVEFGTFVTLLFTRIDTSSRTIQYVNAGHPPGYVLDRSGDVKVVMEGRTYPVALFPETDFPLSGEIGLEDGDVIVLVTDGLLEAYSPEGKAFGADRMLEVVRCNRDRSASEIVEALQVSVRRFADSGKLEDDSTVVVIKVGTSTKSVDD